MNKTQTNKSKSFEVTITDIGAQGDGIANRLGKRYYIPYSAPGDQLLVSPGAERKEGRSAKIETIITGGNDRVAPRCGHFQICGGCALQHLSISAISRSKRDFIVTALARRGLSDVVVLDTINIAAGSRRRVRFAAKKLARRVLLGFRAPRGRNIIDIQECPAVRPSIIALVEPLRVLVRKLESLGNAASISITESESGLDILLQPERPAELTLPDREKIAQFANFNDLARIAWDDPRGPEPVSQRREPLFRFGTSRIRPPVGAFLQPSVEGERAILDAIVKALREPRQIADLYAGCGTLSFPLSSIAPTHAFEGDGAMVATIRRGATRNELTANERDLDKMPLTPRELTPFDTVVFDPPRAGAKSQAAMLAESTVGCVIAVSCNPATLARDLRLLVDGGYEIESVLPVDQFPWSPHVEAVAILRRNTM